MSLVPNSFRTAAIGVGTAIAAFGSLAVAPSFSDQAFAQPRSPAGSSAVCTGIKSDAAYIRCMDGKIRALKADTALEDKRGAEADKKKAASEAITACTDYLHKGIQNGLFTLAAVKAAANMTNGKMAPEKACPVARSFGFQQNAELVRPDVSPR